MSRDFFSPHETIVLRPFLVFGRRHTAIPSIPIACVFDLSLPYKVLVRAVDNNMAMCWMHNCNIHETELYGVCIYFNSNYDQCLVRPNFCGIFSLRIDLDLVGIL